MLRQAGWFFKAHQIGNKYSLSELKRDKILMRGGKELEYSFT